MRSPLSVALTIAAFVVIGCGSSAQRQQALGGTAVRVSLGALTQASQVSRVTVTASPTATCAGATTVTRDLTLTNGAYLVSLELRPCTYDFSVSAYADSAEVAVGTAGGITVSAGSSQTLVIPLRDKSGPVDVPDHGPLVTLLTASPTDLDVGQHASLSVTAVDPDGPNATLTFLWTATAAASSTCASPQFSAATSPTTEFWSDDAASCVVRATVTSGALSDYQEVPLGVVRKVGTVNVSSQYYPAPLVAEVRVSQLGQLQCDVTRAGQNASCTAIVAGATSATVEIVLSSADLATTGLPFQYALTDDCGGTVQGATGASFTWLPPATAAVCTLAAKATRTDANTLSDTFPVAFRVSTASCSFNLASDPANCGSCGSACAYEHANPLCVDGTCGMGACTGQYANCDLNVANGCEVNVASDPNHCGACSATCPSVPNGIRTCESGACGFQCNQPYTKCSSSCRNTSTDPANCGACGMVCGLGATCTAGTCVYTSCAAIHQANPSFPTGTYNILPNGYASPISVTCDMTTNGGGWCISANCPVP